MENVCLFIHYEMNDAIDTKDIRIKYRYKATCRLQFNIYIH